MHICKATSLLRMKLLNSQLEQLHALVNKTVIQVLTGKITCTNG
jgi:hypothetical protein